MTQRQAYGDLNKYTPAGKFKPIHPWFGTTCVMLMVATAVLCVGFALADAFNRDSRVKMGEAAKVVRLESTLDSMTLRLDAKDLKIEQLLAANVGVRLALETCLEGR